MLERALNDLKNPKTKTAYLQILATFTGADGSMGFTAGQRYELIEIGRASCRERVCQYV